MTVNISKCTVCDSHFKTTIHNSICSKCICEIHERLIEKDNQIKILNTKIDELNTSLQNVSKLLNNI